MTQSLHPHDPQKAIADLRDHLARHDKPIAFLFGAGTSCAVRVPRPSDVTSTDPFIPAVAQLTLACKAGVDELGQAYSLAWVSIAEQCAEKKLAPNIESILTCLRMMLRATGRADRLAGLDRSELAAMEKSIRKTIARVVTPNVSGLPGDFPHRSFARWIAKTSRKSPVEIFTVNYDVLFEHALETERVCFFDGFVGGFYPYFFPESLRHSDSAPGAAWTRLWKLHGSVTWHRRDYGGRPRIVRGAVDSEGEMILPSFEKYDESRQQPYSAFTDRLGRFLELDDALLITSGFSFGDEHINDLLFSALDSRPRTHIYALQFEEISQDSDLAKRSVLRPNIIVVGPRTAIFRGQRAPWRPDEPPPFMADLFEVNYPAVRNEAEADGQGVGEMKIGDFATLCRFLESMLPG